MKIGFVSHSLLLAGALIAIADGRALAQASDSSAIEEVVVTARKRDETSISVPVAVTALGYAQLNRLAVNNFDDVARFVPGLIVGEGGGTFQGGDIAIRGIGGVDGNGFADQAVSFNIDGVQVASALVRRLAEMDMAQVEVLKGPQALFFGKNSPAGVISVRTADPTQDYEGRLETGYEFVGHETRSDGYVSGPITDELGGRLAAYVSSLRGWTQNIAQGVLAPNHTWGPNSDEYAVRGTLKYDPTDNFSARAKLAFNRISGDSTTWNFQEIACPLGAPQLNPVHECAPNQYTETGNIGTSFGKADPRFGDGVGFLRQQQLLGSLEMNYNPSDQITLTSVSGVYLARYHGLANFTEDYALPSVAAVTNQLTSRQVTEEVRISSSFNAPVNFLAGMFYQDTRSSWYQAFWFNANHPTFGNNYYMVQNGTAWSVFGQVRWDVIDTVELDAGGRYSFEEKTIPVLTTGAAAHPTTLTAITPSPDDGRWNNFSPELTATWRPSNSLTLYGSYKRGFLSGGFNAGSSVLANGVNLKYDQETISGFEVGAKAALLDDHLRLNFAAYTYSIKGLQNQLTINNIQILTNAGKVAIEGFEFDATYKPPIDGLTLTGDVAYNHGRYDNYQATCLAGQSIAAGCNIAPNAAGIFTAQNLGGTQLVRSPLFSGNFGFDYQRPVGWGLVAGLSSDVNFTTSYLSDTGSNPYGREPGYQLVDATLRLGDENEDWQVSLIGRNLTDQYYWVRSATQPFTGSGTGRASAVPWDTIAVLSRGREILLRLAVEFK